MPMTPTERTKYMNTNTARDSVLNVSGGVSRASMCSSTPSERPLPDARLMVANSL